MQRLVVHYLKRMSVKSKAEILQFVHICKQHSLNLFSVAAVVKATTDPWRYRHLVVDNLTQIQCASCMTCLELVLKG